MRLDIFMAEKKGLRIRKISNNMTKSNQSREIEIINGTKIYLTKKQKKISWRTERHVCALFMLMTHNLVCPTKESNLLEQMMCVCTNARSIYFYYEYSLSL